MRLDRDHLQLDVRLGETNVRDRQLDVGERKPLVALQAEDVATRADRLRKAEDQTGNHAVGARGDCLSDRHDRGCALHVLRKEPEKLLEGGILGLRIEQLLANVEKVSDDLLAVLAEAAVGLHDQLPGFLAVGESSLEPAVHEVRLVHDRSIDRDRGLTGSTGKLILRNQVREHHAAVAAVGRTARGSSVGRRRDGGRRSDGSRSGVEGHRLGHRLRVVHEVDADAENREHPRGQEERLLHFGDTPVGSSFYLILAI